MKGCVLWLFFRNVVSHALQTDNRVNVLDTHTGWNRKADGGIIKDALDACFNQLIGYILCHRGRDCQHGHLDAGALQIANQVVGIFNFELSHLGTDFGRIAVLAGHNPEPAVYKTLVA